MHATRAIRILVAVFVAVAAALLVACGSSPEKQGFSGEWVSTGGSELLLQIGAPTDGSYPVTFSGGEVERTLSATQENEMKYRAEGETDVWVFNMVDDELMNVTIIAAGGEAVTTTFKRAGSK